MIRHAFRLLLPCAFVIALRLAPGGTTLAGDGGTVEVTDLPAAPSVGQPLRINFIVRSHGQPTDTFGTAPIKPYLTATNRATGESLRADGYKDGDVGEFAVEVAFPSPGEWSLLIKAEPLAVGTWIGTLTVGTAHAGSTARAGAVLMAFQRWSVRALLDGVSVALRMAVR